MLKERIVNILKRMYFAVNVKLSQATRVIGQRWTDIDDKVKALGEADPKEIMAAAAAKKSEL